MRLMRSFFVLACQAVVLGAVAAPAPMAPVEKLLPDDTLVVVTIPDFAKFREVCKSSPQTQLWADAAMKPFKDKLVSKLREELIAPLERELGAKLEDFTSLPQGQLTFAVTQNGWQGGDSPEPAALLLLDARDKSDLLKKNLGDLRKKWLDAGKTLRTEKIRDIEFSIFSISDKDLPPTLRKMFTPSYPGETDADTDTATNKPKSELLVGQFQSMLIVGTSSKAVEKVAAHLTGAALPALGDLAAYDADRLAFFRESPVYGWVNVKAFLDVLAHKPAAGDSATPDPFAMFGPDKIAGAMGFGGVKSVALALQTSGDGIMFQIFVGAPESGRRGLMKVLTADAKDAGPPPFVPADVAKFQRMRIDGQKAWAALQKMIGELSPQWANSLNFIIDTANASARQKDPDFDINKNLFGNLGDDLIIYEKAPHGTSLAELRTSPSLILIGSPHAEQLENALKSTVLTLIYAQGAAPTEREFLGRKIYSVSTPGAVPGTTRSLSYAASGGYVALSSEASMLEDFLRSSDSPQKALRDAPGFADAVAKVGGSGSGWFGYENQAETTRGVFELLRKAGGRDATSGVLSSIMGVSGAEDRFKDWLDFSLLPSFDTVSKYFYISVTSGSTTVNGLTFKVFAPVPPQLKK
jgi:hypothetical protein